MLNIYRQANSFELLLQVEVYVHAYVSQHTVLVVNLRR